MMDEGGPPAASEMSRGDRGELVVRAVGELDAAAAPLFGERLEEAIDASDSTVVVDLAAVTFMDSTGLAVLVGGRQRLAGEGRRLRITRPSRPVVRLLEIAGLQALLDDASQPSSDGLEANGQ